MTIRDALDHGTAPALRQRYHAVRRATEALGAPLTAEDQVVQSMPDASPVKWHLAHTTWFFETFVLAASRRDYTPFHPAYNFLFNSYYETVGPRLARNQRGLLTRPTVSEVAAYRAHVDAQMDRFLSEVDESGPSAAAVVLGLQHEQQHQELILTDLKHAWAANPLQPVYRPQTPHAGSASPCRWLGFSEGIAWLGHEGPGFAFDNETPRHRVFVHAFQLASRLTTVGEYLEFIEDGGYQQPNLWLSDGWAIRQQHGWAAPLYWERVDGGWRQFTLHGSRPLVLDEPVCHVSYYEADAFARWAGARPPTEAEWETAAATVPLAGHFADAGRLHPVASPARDDTGPLTQMFGDVWQWTASPYVAYPGFEPAAGLRDRARNVASTIDMAQALSEYNGKFMINQMVLRGASCVTPESHARRTYRNFFAPHARWQFSGIRLAKDA